MSPVVVEGSADVVHEWDAIAPLADLMNEKHGGVTAEFLAAHVTIRVARDTQQRGPAARCCSLGFERQTSALTDRAGHYATS